jgi:predicted RecB family endonuclease
VRAACQGTKRDGQPCTAGAMAGERWCYHHHPAYADERRRNASRAATLGNSKIGAEIRSTRLLVRDIVELTITNELYPLVRKRLTEVVQLLQVYARLAELEIVSGKRPKAGDVAIPEDTAEKVKEWAHGEDGMMREWKELVEELSQAMRAKGHDPTPIREAVSG